MFQGSITPHTAAAALAASELGASRRVSRGIMRALELGQLVPGQRLIETQLAAEYRVGRNAVREAVQWLSATGVIDLSRYRSAALRELDPVETLEVLEVAEAVIGLLLKAAARRLPNPGAWRNAGGRTCGNGASRRHRSTGNFCARAAAFFMARCWPLAATANCTGYSL